MIDVFMLGDVTFMGKVVAKEWYLGIYIIPETPAVDSTIEIEYSLDGDIAFSGKCRVDRVVSYCENGFSGPVTKVWVTPVSDLE